MKIMNKFCLMLVAFLAIIAQPAIFASETTEKAMAIFGDEKLGIIAKNMSIIRSATADINDARDALFYEGTTQQFDQLNADKIIKQVAILVQAEQQLKKVNDTFIEEIAKKENQEGYWNRFVAGVKRIGAAIVAPFKAGYGYTQEEKETARYTIEKLVEQQEKITEKYESFSQSKKAQMKTRYEAVMAQFNDAIFQQKVITGDVMSSEKKMLLGTVAAGSAAAGLALAKMYFEGTPEQEQTVQTPIMPTEETSIETVTEEQIQPTQLVEQLPTKSSEVVETSPIAVSPLTVSEVETLETPTETFKTEEFEEQTTETSEPELLVTEESEEQTPEEVTTTETPETEIDVLLEETSTETVEPEVSVTEESKEQTPEEVTTTETPETALDTLLEGTSTETVEPEVLVTEESVEQTPEEVTITTEIPETDTELTNLEEQEKGELQQEQEQSKEEEILINEAQDLSEIEQSINTKKEKIEEEKLGVAQEFQAQQDRLDAEKEERIDKELEDRLKIALVAKEATEKLDAVGEKIEEERLEKIVQVEEETSAKLEEIAPVIETTELEVEIPAIEESAVVTTEEEAPVTETIELEEIEESGDQTPEDVMPSIETPTDETTEIETSTDEVGNTDDV